MHATSINFIRGLAALLLVFGLAGCDAFEVFDREKEVSGTVEEVGADYLIVDGITYEVTSRTEYEGITGLSDLAVGMEVEVEYEENGGTRTAVEIELAGADDDDGGLFG